MRELIDQLKAQLSYAENYATNTADFTEAYDHLLADDSAYHTDHWKRTIIAAVQQVDPQAELTDKHIERIIEQVIADPSWFCQVEVGDGMCVSELCVASFGIGELYEQLDVGEELTSEQLDEVMQAIEQETDWIVSESYNGMLDAYLYMGTTAVTYTLDSQLVHGIYWEMKCEELEAA